MILLLPLDNGGGFSDVRAADLKSSRRNTRSDIFDEDGANLPNTR